MKVVGRRTAKVVVVGGVVVAAVVVRDVAMGIEVPTVALLEFRNRNPGAVPTYQSQTRALS